jgi:hypothetical protein
MTSACVRPLLLAIVCTIAPAIAFAQPALTRRDSIDIARAVWSAASQQPARPTDRVVRLWLPSDMDSARVVPLSPAARTALERVGLPVTEARPTGDDTVVVTFADWRPAAGTQGTRVLTVRVRSSWTTILQDGPRACRAGSSSLEQFRVMRRGAVWTADRMPGAIHGDTECVAVP